MFLTVSFSLIFLTTINFSCSKENENTGHVSLYLTDAPASYDAVNIDITNVMIKTDAETEEIDVELEKPGVYNLLDFSGGLDTLLGSIDLPVGNVSQLRLILGENNSIVVDGDTLELKVPSGSQSGLKVNLHQEIVEGENYKLVIDFDASRSVVSQGNGKYILKPVIRVFSETSGGTIKGNVDPTDALPFVSAVNETDTIGTVANAEGKFVLNGVPEGTYKLTLLPQNGMNELIVNDVEVLQGKTTNVGKLTLK